MGRSKFTQEVLRVVREVPKGRVVSYGQVALMTGVPRGARAVGWILRQAQDYSLPWWRVINGSGRISIKNMFHTADEQRSLLRAEGVEVGEDFGIDIEKYRFVAGLDGRHSNPWE